MNTKSKTIMTILMAILIVLALIGIRLKNAFEKVFAKRNKWNNKLIYFWDKQVKS